MFRKNPLSIMFNTNHSRYKYKHNVVPLTRVVFAVVAFALLALLINVAKILELKIYHSEDDFPLMDTLQK